MMSELESLEHSVRGHMENVVLLSRVHSTHDMAIRLVDDALNDELEIPPTLILAESQSSGHGRSGRQWYSPAGGLYMTLVWPKVPQHAVHRLPMAAAAAAVACLREAGARVGLKWPNDLVSGNRKLGGLLLHSRSGRGGRCVVSLGLNVARTPNLPPDAVAGAVSLADLLGGDSAPPARTDLAASFVRHLAHALDHIDEAAAAWRSALVHREGDPVEIHLDDGGTVSGTFAGVTAEGFLRLKTGGVERILTTGEVGLTS